MILAKFLGWEECSLEDYETSCQEYGFNCESAPEFLSFKLQHNAPLKFFSFKKKVRLLGVFVLIKDGSQMM
jgi:hypothetical protein